MSNRTGLHIYVSNRLEVLAQQLAETVRIPISSPFQPETVIVQSRGMERWVSLALARHNGICANVSFPFPNAFVQEISRRIDPKLPEKSPFDREVMTFRIVKRLPVCIDQPGFEDLKTYLSEDERGLKRYQLSQHIADAFDQYLVFRPEMIFTWESGKENHWQARLWRELVAETETPHRAQIRSDLIHAMQDRPDAGNTLPERINIFGISYLPRFHMEVFAALSKHISVNLFLMSPCREYWADIVSDHEKKRIRNIYAQREITDTDLHLESGNRLLVTMGTQARDFFGMISGLNVEFDEAYVDPDGTTLLSCIQKDILNLEDRPRVDANASSIETVPSMIHDTSIQFHACHSPIREIEVLYNHLLAMFEEDADLTPRDIIVMTPDIDRYAPFIQAVFSSPGNESMKIPFSIADRNIRRERRLIEAFLCCMELKGTRFGAAQIKALLEFSHIREKFGLTQQNLDIIEQWIRETGIRWGIDVKNRERLGLPAYPENTWQFGIDRLLLGYAMPGYGLRLYSNILSYDHVEGQEAKVLGRFIEFIDRIVHWAGVFEHTKTLADWGETFLKLLDELFAVDDDTEKDFQMIRRYVEAMARIQKLSGFETPVPFEVVRVFLTDCLETEAMETGFISGGVTFCAMLPMRSIPFDVVCLIGMNNDAFPRESQTVGFDLLRKHPMPGDRSRRHDDRYLFLEAIISARRRLYISYVGQSIQDNTRIPPSVLVSELMDYISEGFYGTDAQLVTRHPLQAFSPEYFADDHGRLFSYSEEDLAAAASLIESKPPLPFIVKALSAPPVEWRRITIQQLAQFFGNPARFLLHQRLGIYLEDRPAPVSERENFQLDPLQRYMMGQTLVEGRQSGIGRDRMQRLLKAGGMLPHGNVGAVVFNDLMLDVEAFLKRIDRFDPGESQAPLDIALELGDFHLLGELDNRYRKGLLQIRYADTKAKDLLHAWVFHLLLCTERSKAGDDPQKTFLICKDTGWEFTPIREPDILLCRLLALYWQGLSVPLHFFPESALTYCRCRLKHPDAARDALMAAHRLWEGSTYRDGWGESDDPYLSICFRHSDPLDEAFEDLAMMVFEPLLSHCGEISI